MIAVHLEKGRVEIGKMAKPRRPPGFASIRLLYGGICNTDLELQRGYYGFTGTPGHEFVGEVIEADTPALVGQRVVGEINLACGKWPGAKGAWADTVPLAVCSALSTTRAHFARFSRFQKRISTLFRRVSQPSMPSLSSRWLPPAKSSIR